MFVTYNREQQNIDELGALLAEASKTVVFVVGAGLSVPAGLPKWSELNDALRDKAFRTIAASDTTDAEKQKVLDKIEKLKDPWLLGDEFKRIIGDNNYAQLIQNLLGIEKEVPDSYKKIWKLNPSGVISFNLDPLAERALGGLKDQVACAIDETQFPKFLLFSKPFLFQPHGILKRPDGWVLGARARNKLLRNTTYRRWISSVFASRRIVILGFQPGDFAFESLLLEDFREQITRGVDHYWICSNPTVDNIALAELYNLKIIEYTPSTSDHVEVTQILDQLASFKPRKPATTVVYMGPAIPPEELPTDDKLRTSNVEDIRRRLNAALKGLVPDNKTGRLDSAKSISNFLGNYSGSVHMAWHIKPGPIYGTVWNFTVLAEIGDGAFGHVWKVRDPVDGQIYALKVLHEEVVGQPGFLEAFQRGVRAMRIVSERHVPGMVKYIDAYDIPACVIMEFVDGITLADAMIAKQINLMADSLRIVENVGQTVLQAHELDEQVLHRDLKPSNIMISNLGIQDAEVQISVLDFDLSWYEGAMGKSMISGTRLHNYIAPEQMETRRSNYSSRHTAVDVYGLGMLLYFAATGADPHINVQNTKDFQPNMVFAINAHWRPPFECIAEYISMIIVEATHDAQERRPALPVVINQIGVVADALENETLSAYGDLIMIDVAVRLRAQNWSVDLALDALDRIVLKKAECTIECEFRIIDPDTGPVLSASIVYAHSGTYQRSKLAGQLGQKIDAAKARLRRLAIFENIDGNVVHETLVAKCSAKPGEWTPERIKAAASTLDDAANSMMY